MFKEKQQHNHPDPLFVELQGYEKEGVSIWLEGSQSSPGQVSKAMQVREKTTYMRDYVFEKGELSEVRFDRITKK